MTIQPSGLASLVGLVERVRPGSSLSRPTPDRGPARQLVSSFSPSAKRNPFARGYFDAAAGDAIHAHPLVPSTSPSRCRPLSSDSPRHEIMASCNGKLRFAHDNAFETNGLRGRPGPKDGAIAHRPLQPRKRTA